MEMDYHRNNSRNSNGVSSNRGGGSLSNTSSSSDLTNNHNHINNNNNNSSPSINSNSHSNHNHNDPMQSWWESVSKARTRITTLITLLPPTSSSSLSSLADSDRPARSLLDSYPAYSSISSSLSGSGDDPLCQWLYDTFQISEIDSDLRLVVLSFIPLITGLYLTRIHSVSTTAPNSSSPSLAGFEAVLLALYSSETKSRSGKPVLVSVPSPAFLASNPSLYHTPVNQNITVNHHHSKSSVLRRNEEVGPVGAVGIWVMCPPLEPQVGVKSTKRASIIGVALHCYYAHISQMPAWSKVDLCRSATSWAGPDCPCSLSLDFHPINDCSSGYEDDNDVVHPNGGVGGGEIIVSQDLSRLSVSKDENSSDSCGGDKEGEEKLRVPLAWELLQPLLRVLGHCLLAPAPLISEEIKEAASVAVRRLYARATHDLSPQAILATKSLVQLDNRARAAAMAAAAAALANASSSNATTPKTVHKPDVFLVSK